MLHHAARRADLTWTPLSSILQAAAGRAWVRTRPVRTYHRTIPVRRGAAVSASEFKDGESSGGSGTQWSSKWSSAGTLHHAEKDGERPAVKESVPSSCEDFLEITDIGARASEDLLTSGTSCNSATESCALSGITSTANSRTRSHHSNSTTVSWETHLPDGERFHGYEDDPPWHEVLESMRDAGDAVPTAMPLASPPVPAELRQPSSREDLYRTLVFLSRSTMTGRTQSLEFLQRLHDRYPDLQSTSSYNFLISIAIGSGELDTADRLMNDMSNHGLDDDLETRMWKVRLLVRRGLWERAWAEQTARGPLPLRIWLEFFGTLKHAHNRVWDPETLQTVLSRRRQPDLIHLDEPRNDVHSPSSPADITAPPSSPSLQDTVEPVPTFPSAPDTTYSGVDAPYASYDELNAAYGDWHSSPSLAAAADYASDGPLQTSSPGLSSELPSNGNWDGNRLWGGRQRAEDNMRDLRRRPRAPSPPGLVTETGRYDTLMRHFPALSAEEEACMPSRVVLVLVEWFMRTGQPQRAFSTSQSYFAGLAAGLDPVRRDECMDIIHPQLVPAKKNLSGHFAARGALKKLLCLHPDLRPNATTLVYLLNSLRSTAECGKLAFALVKQYHRLYGPDIVDERVRWRLAWLALKERNVPLAVRVFSQHDRAQKRERKAEESLEREFSPQASPTGLPARPPFHEIVAARGLEDYWVPLRHRLRRISQS